MKKIKRIKDNSYMFVGNWVPFNKLGKTLGRAGSVNKIELCFVYINLEINIRCLA